MPPTQIATKTDLYTQIQEIISLKLEWSELTIAQKTLFANPLLLASLEVKSNLEVFNLLNSQQNTLFTTTKELNATVDAALLSQLVDDMHENTLSSDLKPNLSKYSLDQQEIIEKLVSRRIEEIRLEKIEKDNKQAIKGITPEVDKLDSKKNPRTKLIQSAGQIIQSATTSSKTPFTKAQKTAALSNFVGAVLTTNDPTNTQTLSLLVATSLAIANPKYSNKNSTAHLYQEVKKAISPATNKDYQQALQNPDSSKILDSQANIIIDLSKLSTLKKADLQKATQSTPQEIKDILDKTIHKDLTELTTPLSNAKKELQRIDTNTQALNVSRTLISQIPNQQLDEVTHSINQINPTILSIPTSTGKQSTSILDKTNSQKTTPSPQAIKLYSQGLTSKTWTKIYQNAKVQQDVTPQQAHTLNQELKQLSQSPLGKEISTPLSQAGRAFQTATNKLSGKLPSKIAKPLNYALHPAQSIKGFVRQRVGKYLGKKIYKAFAKKITNKTARLIAKTLLREGVNQGVKTLAKLGLEASLVAGGVTAPIALIMVVWDVVVFAGKKVVQGIQNLAQSIWGEKIKARDLLALPALGIAAIGSTLVSLGSVTIAAAGSAGTTIIISTLAGFFVYVTALTVAPLISTIAQLEEQPASQLHLLGSSGTGSPGDPDYVPPVPTGPIPPGCPTGWPTKIGYITQGAKTSSTHRSAEAIDIGGVGTGTPIYATHPGLAVAGYNGTYGNYVDVYGVCQGVNFTTRYAHMPAMPFQGERTVALGENIGVTNNTGSSTGSHLHYTIRGGVLGDLNQFLPKPVPRGCIEFTNCQITIP